MAMAGALYFAYRRESAPEASRVTLNRSVIADVTPMLRLCTVEFYDDVPVKGSVGNRHIFARMAMKGSISFDLDNVEISETADSIVITLPREIVDIYESTDSASYQVIDTWNDHLLGSSRMTTVEENQIKSDVRARYRRDIYRKGYVARARRDAADYLTTLLTGITGKTVTVNDPTPYGNP